MRTSSPTCSAGRRVSVSGSGSSPETPRARAGERRRDEEQQLVDEAGARRRRWRASGRPRGAATARPARRAARARPRAGRSSSSSSEPSGSGPLTEREAPRLPLGADVARGQLRVVGAHRAHADRDRVHPRAQLVHAAAALLAGHPARARDGDASVERDRRLVDDERPPLGDPDAEGLVLDARPPLELAARELDLDPGGAEPLEAARRSSRVRVADRRDDRANSGLDERVRARRRSPVVGAGLERDVERRAARPLARRLERGDLRVRAAGPLVPALAHDLAVADEHRADDRIRGRRPASPLGELERPLEPCSSFIGDERADEPVVGPAGVLEAEDGRPRDDRLRARPRTHGGRCRP